MRKKGWIVALMLVFIFLFSFMYPNESMPRLMPVSPPCSHPPTKSYEVVSKLLELWDAYLMSPELSNDTPRPPHLQNCRALSIQNNQHNTRDGLGNRPNWTLWKGAIFNKLGKDEGNVGAEVGEGILGNMTSVLEGPLPPWVDGGDEDNLPMTRRVQRDLWVLQHPKNCDDPSLRFLLADWDSVPNLGLGAQINFMSGVFAIALRENRILVSEKFSRASHQQCKGSDYERWSCYFAPETSCRKQAEELKKQPEAWKQGLIRHVTSIQNWDDIWFPKIPEYWGRPWEHMQPSEAVMGELVMKHKSMDLQWWRSQVVKYWTRFPSEYLCTLLNDARHKAFGEEAAKLVAESLPSNWPNVPFQSKETAGESILWSRQGPWVPRPLLSMHVRQGDKASEMKLYNFDVYMKLAQRARERFPDLKNIWLSTEMESVVQESKNYTDWSFFYTQIPRQNGTTTMGDYEKSLGTEQGSKNAFVNLMLAADCDYFVGVLGSTWSFLLNGLRTTSGKVKSGFLSVNLGTGNKPWFHGFILGW